MRGLLSPALILVVACSSTESIEPTQSWQQDLCVGGTYVEGVDVSYAQPVPIGWGSVRNAGAVFAIAKASEGTAINDTAFPSNWPAMRAAGVTRGAYHFFKGSVDGASQANHYIAVVNANGGFQAGDLPPAVDVEFSSTAAFSSLTGNDASDIQRLHATLDTLEAVTGRKPIIYTNNNTWSQLGNPSGFGAYPVWLANWDAQCTLMPPGLTNLKFWQYTSTGSVPGISGNVDRDRFNGTASDLLAFAGSSSTPVCGSGLYCAGNLIPGSSSCLSGSSTIFCCPSGQTIVNGACSGSTPVCGSGLYCAGNQIPGSSACLSGSSTIFCCPSGQTIVNGACTAPPPPCGTGLFCAANQIPGSSACTSGSSTIFCCASGHTIVNGACSP